MKKLMSRSLFFFATIFVVGAVGCTKDDVQPDGNGKNDGANLPAIELCNILESNGDVILESDPDRPVDYLVDCHIGISQRKLIIKEGAILEFTENGRISIDRYFDDNSGAIIAKGTAEQPIIFRGTSSNKGHWRGIAIFTDNINNELDHVEISDAGRGEYTYGGQGALFSGNAGYYYGRIKLTNSIISNSQGNGLNIAQPAGTTIEGLVITNNTFKNNDLPIRASIHTMHVLKSSNTIIGNDRNEIDVLGSSNSTDNTLVDATWYNVGVPYVFTSNVYIDSKITVEPGTIFKFPLKAGLSVGRVSGHQGTGGGLIAKGTSEQPIVFTGVEKTNNFWKGIRIESAYPQNEISHAIIEYTGIISSDPSAVYNVFVNMNGFSKEGFLKINNTTFRNSNTNECAVWAYYHDENTYGIVDIDEETIYVEEGHCKLRDS